MARTTEPQAFSWRQFKVMLRVIIRGEQHLDSTGMGFGDSDAADRRKGFWGSLGSGARKVAIGFLFLLLAAMFFMMGFMLGDLGVSPYTAFSLCVVCLVGLTVLTGLYQAVNILYFVRDLGYYLTLPVSATTVMWAKLAHFLGMSLLGDLIILPVGLGCLLANGAAGGPALKPGAPGWEAFLEAVAAVQLSLAQQIVRDGEGATRFVTVAVEKAATPKDALAACRAIANSPLFKTACFGGDPNWGRVISAVGNSGAKCAELETEIYFDDVCVFNKGTIADARANEALSAVMAQRAFTVRVVLNQGTFADAVYTTDFSYEYVKINGEYTT